MSATPVVTFQPLLYEVSRRLLRNLLDHQRQSPE